MIDERWAMNGEYESRVVWSDESVRVANHSAFFCAAPSSWSYCDGAPSSSRRNLRRFPLSRGIPQSIQCWIDQQTRDSTSGIGRDELLARVNRRIRHSVFATAGSALTRSRRTDTRSGSVRQNNQGELQHFI